MTTARKEVNTALSAVETARVTLEKDIASQLGELVEAQNAVDEAQAAVNKNLPVNEGTMVDAQNAADEAASDLNAARGTLADAEASAATSIQNAQSQLDQATQESESAKPDNAPAPAPARTDTPDPVSAQARIESAKAALQASQNDLKAATLVAPSAGVVASVNGAVGQQVRAGSANGAGADAFITLSESALPALVAQLNEADLKRVLPGQQVTFALAEFPGRTFSGSVARIDVPGQGAAEEDGPVVVVTVNPTDVTLLPSMAATLSIVTQQAIDTPMIPLTALSYAADRGFQSGPSGSTEAAGRAAPAGVAASAGRSTNVLVLRDGQPATQPIRVGINDERNIQVIFGLEPNDSVVVNQVVSAQPKSK